MFLDDEEEDYGEPPVNKRKRISNAETIELMMKSEAERERTNASFLEILGGFKQQGELRNQLLEKLVNRNSSD